MEISVKRTVKFAAGICAVLGIAAVGAVAASGAAVKVMAEGIKTGADVMKKIVADLQTEKSEEDTTDIAEANGTMLTTMEEETVSTADQPNQEEFEH